MMKSLKRRKKTLLLSVEDEHLDMLRCMADKAGMKNPQEVITTFISVMSAYERRYKKARRQPTIEDEVNTMLDSLAADSALLSEINGWSVHQGIRSRERRTNT